MSDWQRTLRVLWLVQFLTTAAINLGLTFVPFFLAEDPILRVADEGRRAIYTGLILAGPFFTTIVFTPLWGWIADRTGPKRQVVRACIGLGLSQLLMALAWSADVMVVIRMIQGATSGVLAAALGLVAVVAPAERRGRAVATLQSATPAGQVLGPLIGGVLALTVGFRATYALLGVLILLAGVLSWRLLSQGAFTPTESPNPFAGLARSARRAVSQPLLRQCLAILLLGQFAFSVAQGVFAIFAGKLIAESGLAPSWWSSGVGFTAIAAAVTALATVATTWYWGILHDCRVGYLTPVGAVLLAISMLVLVIWPPWWGVLLARLGVGAGIGAVGTLQFATLSGGAQRDERGQLMSLAVALTHAGNLLGFSLAGLIAAGWSESVNFAVAAVGYVLVAAAGIRLELHLRRVPLPAQGGHERLAATR